MKIHGKKQIRGNIKVPGDKSISHRGIMLGALSKGKTSINNILFSEDTLRTIDCFKAMGVPISIDIENSQTTILSEGLDGLKQPNKTLNCENSGTTMRLIAGILLGQNFKSTLIGDISLNNRPMDRIIKPLSLMGGNIIGVENSLPPLNISPSQNLIGIDYILPVPSAQVKSAILLATLYSKGVTRVEEPKITRDHTERMLKYLGADINSSNNVIEMKGNSSLIAKDIFVPGDISSAAFFIVAATIIEGSSITIKDVGINPTRIGLINVLLEMGARIKIENKRVKNNEPFADIKVETSPLKGVTLGGNITGTLIDEIPILAVAATFAEGTTIIKDVSELKYKETDRIKAIVRELKKMGANIEEMSDGIVIKGTESLNPNIVESYNDHRIAMSLAIAALNTEGITEIQNSECVNISYPNFYRDLQYLWD